MVAGTILLTMCLFRSYSARLFASSRALNLIAKFVLVRCEPDSLIATTSSKTLPLVHMVSQADDLALEVEAKRRQSAAPPSLADSLAPGATSATSAPSSTVKTTHFAESSGSAAAAQLGSGSTFSANPRQDDHGGHAHTDSALDQQQRQQQQQRFGAGLWWPSSTGSGAHEEASHPLLCATTQIAFDVESPWSQHHHQYVGGKPPKNVAVLL